MTLLPQPTLIVQDNSVRWTKATRGADRPVQRPRMNEPARLTALPGPEHRQWIHRRQACERLDFQIMDACGPDGAKRAPDQSVHEDVLRWRWMDGAALLSLHEPAPDTRQTRWPARLPDPVATVRPGVLVRIDWNMRARLSLFGSNRASHFEEHTIFVTMTHQPGRDLFVKQAPDKRIDLRVGIY